MLNDLLHEDYDSDDVLSRPQSPALRRVHPELLTQHGFAWPEPYYPPQLPSLHWQLGKLSDELPSTQPPIGFVASQTWYNSTRPCKSPDILDREDDQREYCRDVDDDSNESEDGLESTLQNVVLISQDDGATFDSTINIGTFATDYPSSPIHCGIRDSTCDDTSCHFPTRPSSAEPSLFHDTSRTMSSYNSIRTPSPSSSANACDIYYSNASDDFVLFENLLQAKMSPLPQLDSSCSFGFEDIRAAAALHALATNKSDQGSPLLVKEDIRRPADARTSKPRSSSFPQSQGTCLSICHDIVSDEPESGAHTVSYNEIKSANQSSPTNGEPSDDEDRSVQHDPIGFKQAQDDYGLDETQHIIDDAQGSALHLAKAPSLLIDECYMLLEIEDRVSYLLQKTGAARMWSETSFVKHRNFDGSIPLSICTPTEDLLSSTRSTTSRAMDEHQYFGLSFDSPVSQCEEKVRSNSVPPNTVRHADIRIPRVNRTTQIYRASSEPPSLGAGRRTYTQAPTMLTGSPDALHSGQVSWKHAGSSNSQRKRKFNSDGQDDGSDAHDDNGEANRDGKRRCMKGSDSDQGTKKRLPCIFHAGEPHHWFDHTAKYKFIAELLRHLESHSFYPCSECFTLFDSIENRDRHRERTPCGKSCRIKRCRRRLQHEQAIPETCEHLWTAEEQWGELFKLQYPEREVPNVFESGSVTTTAAEIQSQSSNLDSFSFMTHLDSSSHNVVGVNEASRTIDTLDTVLEAPNEATANITSGSSQAVGSSRSELQALREYLKLVEERMNHWAAHPRPREEELETTLGLVWQALTRCNSLDAQPNSMLWRLVRRTAPDVVNAASVTTQQHPFIQEDTFNATLAPSALEWALQPEDQNFEGSSQYFRSDSGYGTGR